MNTLQLPPTLRSATADELPQTAEYRQRLLLLENALIVPGYAFRENVTVEDPFNFFAEINVDNDRLWALFTALVQRMPKEVCLLYHHVDESPAYTGYMDRDTLLEELEPLAVELTRDCFLCLGILHHTEQRLEETYITNAKYVQCWNVDENIFHSVLDGFGLSQIDGLQFIDEFPRVTTPLSNYIPDCLDTWEVLGRLLKRFGQK